VIVDTEDTDLGLLGHPLLSPDFERRSLLATARF
jgi:hypothetical protein